MKWLFCEITSPTGNQMFLSFKDRNSFRSTKFVQFHPHNFQKDTLYIGWENHILWKVPMDLDSFTERYFSCDDSWDVWKILHLFLGRFFFHLGCV